MRARHMAISDSLIPVRLDQRLEPSDFKRSGRSGSAGTCSLKWVDLILRIQIGRTILDKGERAHRGDLGFRREIWRATALVSNSGELQWDLGNGDATTALSSTRWSQKLGSRSRLCSAEGEGGGWNFTGGSELRVMIVALDPLQNRQCKVVGEMRQFERKGIEGRRGQAAHRWWRIPPRRPADWRSSDNELLGG
jgi:hypothetical protein